MAIADDVLAAALELPIDERARIAHELIRSLDIAESDSGAESAWTAELSQRLADIREGTATLMDLDEVDGYVASRVAEVAK